MCDYQNFIDEILLSEKFSHCEFQSDTPISFLLGYCECLGVEIDQLIGASDEVEDEQVRELDEDEVQNIKDEAKTEEMLKDLVRINILKIIIGK